MSNEGFSLFTTSFVVRPSTAIVPPPSVTSFRAFRAMAQPFHDPITDGPCWDDKWYHHAALCRMYHDTGRPVPTHILEWAKSKVDFLDALRAVEPAKYAKVPLFKLISAYSIYYGVHGQLETYHLATGKVTHDNIVDTCRRMSTIVSMRHFLNQDWECLISDTATYVTNPMSLGCTDHKCTFALSPSFEPGFSDGVGSCRSDIKPKPTLHRLVMQTAIEATDFDEEHSLLDKAIRDYLQEWPELNDEIQPPSSAPTAPPPPPAPLNES